MNWGMMGLVLGVGAVAWMATGAVRSYALRRLLDVPNERSSHVVVTPRGGGVAIVVASLLGFAIAAGLGHIPRELLWAVAGGGLLVAAVGFADDHGHVPAAARLACHFTAFGWAIWWLGSLPPVDFGWGGVDLGVFGTAALLFYLVWYLNLFNFMDGIDGIASLQAITMTLGGVLLLAVEVRSIEMILPFALLTAAVTGFLVWNWPPARIFMGDVGSGFLGFALGALALHSTAVGRFSVWIWIILGGAFFVDATVTLFRRAVSGQRLAEAHRSHAYQRLARYWRAHLPVSLTFVAINLFWLLPLAFAASRWPAWGAAITGLALAPLVTLAWRLGAGLPGDLGRRL